MKRLGIWAGWAFLLCIAFFVAVLHAGCGSQAPPPVAKPEPKMTEEIPLVCLQVFRGDLAPVVLCGSQQMCESVHRKVEQYWDELQKGYGTSALSDCTPVNTRFTER